MLILDAPTTVENGRLRIPLYHRGHLSLKSETEVTVCLVPRSEEGQLPRMSEMIISPIPFLAWKDLWRITAEFYNRPGVVHQLLRVLSERNIKVLVEESSSNDNRRLHLVEMIADASGYHPSNASSGLTQGHSATRLSGLERRLLAICVDDLYIAEEGPRLRVQRMNGLYAAWRKFQETQAQESGLHPIETRSVMEKAEIIIPADVLAALVTQVGFDPALRPSECKLQAIMVSDTRDRLLRIFFPKVTEQLLYVRINYIDTPDALAAITYEIAQKFDILTGLTRVHNRGRNHFEVLLALPEGSPQIEHPRQQLSQLLEGLLSVKDLQHFDLKISYPMSAALAGDEGISLKPRPRKSSLRRSQISTSPQNLHELSTNEIIKLRIQQCKNRLSRPRSEDLQALDQTRLNLMKQIQDEEGTQYPTTSLFISYEFGCGNFYEAIKAILKKKKITHETGLNPGDLPQFRDVLIERIHGVDGFLGIWTGSGKDVSPWLHWELGVAQAFKLPFRLIISDKIDPVVWNRINPQQHHCTFGDVNFEKQSELSIKWLLNDIKSDRNKRKLF